jgi:hypothetical protein
MKRFLLGICWAALISPLAAQQPAATVPAKSNVQQVGLILGGACHDNCGSNKVCVSECTTTKTTKAVYSSKCIEYCLPRCSLLGGGHCDGSCAENCGPVRTKNVQLKKVVTTECPSTHCVVREGPACVTTTSATIVVGGDDGKK